MDNDVDDFGNASGSVLISHLGWKEDDPLDADSESSSDESLTGSDDNDLERFLSTLRMDSNASDVDSECCLDDGSLMADDESLAGDCESSDIESVCSFDAPPYSPVQCLEDNSQDINRSEGLEGDSESVERVEDQPAVNQVDPAQQNVVNDEQSHAIWNGFKLVGDNFDKNFYPSIHRVHMKTTSIQYFHFYAVRDRINCSSLSDAPRSDPIDVTRLLVNLTDVTQFNDDAIVLISRSVIEILYINDSNGWFLGYWFNI